MRPHQYLWRMVLYLPGLFLLNLLVWISVHLWPLAPGWISQEFFNSLTGQATVGLNPWSLIALLVAVGLARFANLYAGFITDLYHRFLMGHLLRWNLIQHILSLPGAQSLNEAPGKTIARLRDGPEHVENTLSLVLDVAGQTLFAIFAVVALARIDATITLVTFLPLCLVILFTHLLSRWVRHYRDQASIATAKVTGAVGEIFAAAQAVQVAGAEKRVIRHLRHLSHWRRGAALKDQLITQIMQALANSTSSVGTGLVLLLSATAMQQRRFTVGDFTLFVYNLGMVAQNTDFLGFWLTNYQQAVIAFRRMAFLLQGAPDEKLVEHTPINLKAPLPDEAPPPAHEPLAQLCATNLTYHYPGSDRGIEGIHLQIRRGSFTVITGRVGAGKSTLLQTLLGLLTAQTGEITWNGQRVFEPAAYLTPPRVAYTAQIPILLSASVRENILMGLHTADLDGAVHTAVLEREIAELEQGLDTLVGHRGVKLSGGQIQRTAAARMFARSPDLLIFDDLSSALDVNTERLLWERVFAKEGATCLVVSHRRTALQRADHIILLKDGRIEDEGSLPALLARCQEMRQIWETETEQR